MTEKHMIIGVMFAVMSLVPLGAAPKKAADEVQSTPHALARMDDATRANTLRDLSAERSALEGELLTWLGNARTDEEMFSAAYLIRDLSNDAGCRRSQSPPNKEGNTSAEAAS